MAWDGISWSALFGASYLIGSIPTAYLAARILSGQDIRDLGDHNAGAANVFRNVGHRAGMAVGAIDIAKGSLAVLLTKLALDSVAAEMVSGVLVVAGHNWPVFLRLRGGRGAATAVGVLIAALPLLTIPVGIVSLVILWFTKKATLSLASCLIVVPFLVWWPPLDYSNLQAGYALLIPIMIGVCHFISVKRAAMPSIEGEQAMPPA